MADMNVVITLSESARVLQRALRALDGGGRIVGMNIHDDPDIITVPTEGMTYPQAMVDNIKGSLQERLNEIRDAIKEEVAKID